MALATDLMGLGTPALLAVRTAQAGNGPILGVTPAGSTYATSTKIGNAQFLISVTGGTTGTTGLGLPAVGGDTGCLLGDPFTVNNATGSTLILYTPPGVTISAKGQNQSTVSITTHTSITMYPVSTTQWVGTAGQ